MRVLDDHCLGGIEDDCYYGYCSGIHLFSTKRSYWDQVDDGKPSGELD